MGGNCAQGKGSKVRGGGKRKIVTRLEREARDIGGEGDHAWKGTPLSASAAVSGEETGGQGVGGRSRRVMEV